MKRTKCASVNVTYEKCESVVVTYEESLPDVDYCTASSHPHQASQDTIHLEKWGLGGQGQG